MLLELTLFVLELFATLAYPALMTLKSLSRGDSKSNKEFESWSFYWISLIVVNGVCWTLDFFPFPYLRPLVLIALALPQLGLATKGSEFIMGPLQDILLENVNKTKETIKVKLG